MYFERYFCVLCTGESTGYTNTFLYYKMNFAVTRQPCYAGQLTKLFVFHVILITCFIIHILSCVRIH